MSLYRPKGSKVFWMDFFFSSQRIRESTKMTSRTRAREVENKRKQELRDGAAGVRKREAPKLFNVAAEEWLDAKKAKWSPGMFAIMTGALKHLKPEFGKRLLVDVEARDIARYQKARMAEGASGRTTNIEIGALRSIMKRSGLWARIQPHVEMLPEKDDAGHALSADEEAAILEECAKSRSRALRPFVVIALETGARYGTIRRLQWKNVDFANRCLSVGKDKTRASSGRTIPLTPRAQETLRFHSEQFPERQPDHYVFPSENYGGTGTDERFGFTAALAYELDPTRPTGSIKKAWQFARERTRRHCPQCKSGRLQENEKGYLCDACAWKTADLPPGVHVRFHDLRHTAVSRMIAARVPLPIIAKIVGWSAGTMSKMSARYGHFSLEEMRSALESISHAPEQISVGSPKKSPNSEASSEGPIQ